METTAGAPGPAVQASPGPQKEIKPNISTTAAKGNPAIVDAKTLSLDDAKTIAGLFQTRFFNRTDEVAVICPKGFLTHAKPESFDNLLLSHLLGPRAEPAAAFCYSSFDKDYHSQIGLFRVGTYGPGEDGKSRYSCVDLDGGKHHTNPLSDAQAAAIAVALNYHNRGFLPYLEKSASGLGWHVWCFFDPPVPAEEIRRIAFSMIPENLPLVTGGLANPRAGKGVEVFPKQNDISVGGFGSLVWLPWWHAAAPGGNQFYHLVREKT